MGWGWGLLNGAGETIGHTQVRTISDKPDIGELVKANEIRLWELGFLFLRKQTATQTPTCSKSAKNVVRVESSRSCGCADAHHVDA